MAWIMEAWEWKQVKMEELSTNTMVDITMGACTSWKHRDFYHNM